MNYIIFALFIAVALATPNCRVDNREYIAVRNTYGKFWRDTQNVYINCAISNCSSATFFVNYKAALTPYVDATNVNLVLPLFGVNVTGIDAVAAVGTSVYEAGNRGERHVVNEPVVECQDWNTFTYETDDVALVNTVNGTQVFGGAKFFKFGRSNPSQPLLIKQLIFTNNWQTIVPGAVWFL